MNKEIKVGTDADYSIQPIVIPSANLAANPVLAVRVGKLRPCDCKDAVDTSKLEDQGIGHNDESITVIPNYVLLKMGHTEIKISMKRFKMFAEWYLSEQDVRHDR
jgi:hypothetical protein